MGPPLSVPVQAPAPLGYPPSYNQWGMDGPHWGTPLDEARWEQQPFPFRWRYQGYPQYYRDPPHSHYGRHYW